MFDGELVSAIALFAGLAALIVYINERSKRRLKTNASPIKLKKMSGNQHASQEASAQETSAQSTDLQEWNFPQPTSEKPKVAPVAPEVHSTPGVYSTPGGYSTSTPPLLHAKERTPNRPQARQTQLGTRAKLRESIVTMTILGPCRALEPFKDRE